MPIAGTPISPVEGFPPQDQPGRTGPSRGRDGWNLRRIRFEETVNPGEAAAEEIVREENLRPWEFAGAGELRRGEAGFQKFSPRQIKLDFFIISTF
jgi:hypothetical protein